MRRTRRVLGDRRSVCASATSRLVRSAAAALAVLGGVACGGGGESGSGSDDRCPPAEGTDERETRFDAPPPMCIDPDATYLAEFSTSAGDFTVELDPALAPEAVNNFVFLARHRYYDGVTFHRIVPDFVIQGGDATGDPPGTGGPGYSFPDELPDSAEAYGPGTFAMANRGPDSNGSQFFVVLAPDKLEPLYSVMGEVVEGFDTTVTAIAESGTAGGVVPMPTVIEAVTVTERAPSA